MVQTILGIAISLSGLLAVLNLSKPRLVLADWWMLGWLSGTASAMVFFFIAYNAVGGFALAASTIANSLLCSCSVFLYLYARAVAGNPSVQPAIHIILPVTNIVLMSALAFGHAVTVTNGAVVVQASPYIGALIALFPPIFLIVNAIYSWCAIQAINERAARTKELGGNWADVRDLLWLRRWALASLLGLIGFGVIYGLSLIGLVNVVGYVGYILLIQTALIAYVGYSGLRETRYFRPTAGRPAAAPQLGHHTNEDWLKIDASLRESRVWVDPHATPEAAAQQIGKSQDTILGVIRRYADGTFFDLMNTYRVEQAKKALCDPACQHQSVLQIGIEAGFGSKSAFYAAFQKYVGTTPAAFRKSGKQS